MIKRAIYQPPSKFRISKPGIDVDTASQADLLLDERVFYSQVYLAGFVAANGGATYTVNYPSLGYAPQCIVYNLFANGRIVYPSSYKYQVGGSAFYYPTTEYQSLPGQLHLALTAADDIAGIYYLIFRRKA